MNWAEHLVSFYKDLQPPGHLPHEIEWLYPQQDPETFRVVQLFFHKFFQDEQPREIFLGINPGRFGAGITGVNFTAPKQLKNDCCIDHHFGNGTELSAEFIYRVIYAYGGVQQFYSHFFIGSVCPLGFRQHGKNLNYYDDKELLEAIEPFITDNISRLVSYQTSRKCLCIGGEKNFKYLQSWNHRFNWFDEIIPLPHPRFIMQYRRKYVQQFVDQYLSHMSH